MRLSGSVRYDPLKKWLSARCGSWEANVATLALATQIGEGKISINYIHDNELYKEWIMSTQREKNVSKLYDLLCYNLKHQTGFPEPEGIFNLAFPEGI